MVTGVGANMPTGGVTVGATPPAQHVPQEAGQPPAQTTTNSSPTTTTTPRRSGENRRVSFNFPIYLEILHSLGVTIFTYFAKKIPFLLRKKNS